MNEIQVFTSQKFGEIRITDNDGQPWFVATDVAKALGYERPNDAIHQHCKKVNKISYGELQYGLNIIPESDVYRLIMRSKLESAESFQDWVVEEVLPTIRKTGSYTTKSNLDKVPDVKYDFLIADELASFLKCSETSRLKIARKIFVKHSCDLTLLPEYVENTQPCLSATDLLKKHDAGIGAAAFNKLMLAAGLLEEHTRRSRTSDKVKKFKALSKEGMEYGQNDTSDQNPNETQPRYFVHKFENLLEKLNLK